MPALLRLVLCCTLFVQATALAQGAAVALRRDGALSSVAVDDLAMALGAPFSMDADGFGFTLRTRDGVLTAFLDRPDVLWQARGAAAPQEVAGALPLRRLQGRWYLPEDLLGLLGAELRDGLLWLPDGSSRPTVLLADPLPQAERTELVPLGPGVEGLRLYAPGAAGPEAVSLLAMDLGLLPLAFPEQREAWDPVLRELRAEKALLLVVTAVAEAAWQPAIFVIQDGRETLLTAPLAVQVLQGDPASVGPQSPVVAVAFLPADIDLRRPLALRWAGATGSWTLRR